MEEQVKDFRGSPENDHPLHISVKLQTYRRSVRVGKQEGMKFQANHSRMTEVFKEGCTY